MVLLTLASLSFGYSTGKTGSSVTGCTCHGASPSADTAVSFSSSTTTVAPGDMLAVQFIVENLGEVSAGLDVTASGGTLTAGSNTQLVGSDITHTSPQALTASFDFSWTAPATEGAYTLYGAGNAVNLNGGTTSDEWNLTTYTITVALTCADNDNDGVTDCDGDCADANAGVYPGQNDTCDGVDSDCDGVVDDDAVFETRYADADGDHYGDPASSTYGCAQPDGSTADYSDCDDTDGSVYPSAAEVWYDGIDQNCDGNDDDQDNDGTPFADDCDDRDPAVAANCDSGAPHDDTGPHDSGPHDTGHPNDTGHPSDDTGHPPGDSTPGNTDSQPAAADSHTKVTPPDDGGCGCESGSGAGLAALFPLLLAAVAGRRRSRVG